MQRVLSNGFDIPLVYSDSGGWNTNTSEAGVNGQADTFDDDLQIDEEEEGSN